MSRALVACLIALGVLALIAPATALAGGPSAGDQQYIDPLAGHHGSGHSQSSGSGSTAPTTSPAPATSSVPSGSSSSSSLNASSSTQTGAIAHDPKGLPFTGFDAPLAALVGVCLLGSGVLLRRAARGS